MTHVRYVRLQASGHLFWTPVQNKFIHSNSEIFFLANLLELNHNNDISVKSGSHLQFLPLHYYPFSLFSSCCKYWVSLAEIVAFSWCIITLESGCEPLSIAFSIQVHMFRPTCIYIVVIHELGPLLYHNDVLCFFKVGNYVYSLESFIREGMHISIWLYPLN